MIWLVLALLLAALQLLGGPRRVGSAATPRFSASKNAQRAEDQPIELVLDLSASLMDSGLPTTELLDVIGSSIPSCSVLRTVARCLELNMEWDRAFDPVPNWLLPLKHALKFAHSTGAPAADLLRNTAVLQRRERAAKVAALGAQFATRLVLPLGACALPAFIALGVVPLIIALFPSMP
ncbi:type II secretion system F family protein [Glutamicibacter sp.]|uniref:type II secretion system F family protein n=1 Tax=Glutamicibacter sp. TaxID=1931995 RepID=UPI0028BD47FC|nr:type II secretion system F family protein [Glutamicibacter sp.]